MPANQDAALARLLQAGASPDPGDVYWGAFPERMSAAAMHSAPLSRGISSWVPGLRLRLAIWLMVLKEHPIEGLIPVLLAICVVWQSLAAFAWFGLDSSIHERLLAFFLRLVP